MFLNIIPELILYGVLIIGGLYIFTILFDYFSSIRRISKRGHDYISLSDFERIFKAFPFNKEKRYYKYFNILDPLTILLLDSLGYDLTKYEIGKSLDDIDFLELANKDINSAYTENKNKDFTRDEMLEFCNSEAFDTHTFWSEFPHVLQTVLDCPKYSEKKPLKLVDINKVKEKLKNKETIRNIISNKAFITLAKAKISAIEELIKTLRGDEQQENYMKLNLRLWHLNLNNATIRDNQSKKDLMQQYQR